MKHLAGQIIDNLKVVLASLNLKLRHCRIVAKLAYEGFWRALIWWLSLNAQILRPEGVLK
jgi:hypothetical protein